MAYLKINQERIKKEEIEALIELCPFSAIYYDKELVINANCKMCKICVKKSKGIITFVEEGDIDKDKWKGIAVYIECVKGKIHPVSFELIGKAIELGLKIKQPVYAFLAGYKMSEIIQSLINYGIDSVFVYDSNIFKDFLTDSYTNALEDFIQNIKPSVILIGATNIGRAIAPLIAARFKTGLTADCTQLEIKENTDLVQIRPAFGGNIMAQIVTKYTRPQLCTVRYKVFSAPIQVKNNKTKVIHNDHPDRYVSRLKIVSSEYKPLCESIEDAEIVVAVGRGVRTNEEIELLKNFAEKIGAVMACTRPMVECGFFDAKRQIGLSGKTVSPKLIVTVGVSGAIQFLAGMQNSSCIIAINSDKNAEIFNVADIGLVGDFKKIIPSIIEKVSKMSNDYAV